MFAVSQLLSYCKVKVNSYRHNLKKSIKLTIIQTSGPGFSPKKIKNTAGMVKAVFKLDYLWYNSAANEEKNEQ